MSETNEQSQLLEHSFLNDSTVFTCSMGSKRISRKTDQTSASRRSLSRRSQENSLERSSVSQFFVKMSTLQKLEEATTASTRNDILRREDSKHEKKRSPTPVPGVQTRRKERQIETVKKDLQIENELLIADLQNKVNQQRQKVLVYEKRSILLEKEVKSKLIKISQLQKTLGRAQQKQKEMASLIKEYQKRVQLNEMNLVDTKSKLQRFKSSIKVNRYAQMESDNLRLRRENEDMKTQMATLEEGSKQVVERCIFLQKELIKFNNRQSQQIQQNSGTLKNQNLETMLQRRDQYTMQLQSRISKLEIQLNYMNRKKLEEIMQWRQKKDKELNRTRNRLVYVNQQLLELKKENERLRKWSFLGLSRASIMSSTTWNTREDILELSLSPDHFNTD